MTSTPVLRARRPLYQLAGSLMPAAPGKQPTVGGGLIFVALFLVVVNLLQVAVVLALNRVAPSTSDRVFFTILIGSGVVILSSPWLYLAAIRASARWSAIGAGQPVLVVADGELRGRLRPVWGDWASTIRPDREDWWDLRLPVDAVRRVRVQRDQPGRPVLILDLPADDTAGLLAGTETGLIAAGWQERVGSPAAWPVGSMAIPGQGEKRLSAILSGLSAAGVPVA